MQIRSIVSFSSSLSFEHLILGGGRISGHGFPSWRDHEGLGRVPSKSFRNLRSPGRTPPVVEPSQWGPAKEKLHHREICTHVAIHMSPDSGTHIFSAHNSSHKKQLKPMFQTTPDDVLPTTTLPTPKHIIDYCPVAKHQGTVYW